MAKFADVFGRLEAFCISILLLVLGYMQVATSTNVRRFAAAQLFYAAGGTGLQILQQIFIADTSSLKNRGLLATIPAVPYMVNVWIGSLVGGAILKSIGWRWGYGMWCIILPAMFMPFAISMFVNNRKAKKMGLTKPYSFKGPNVVQGIKNLCVELDLGGTLLLSAAFALILLPLTIASKSAKGWADPGIIAMFVLGVVCLIAFPFWEKYALKPLLPFSLLKNRTFCAGCAIGFLYFSKFSSSPLCHFLISHSGILPFHPTILLLVSSCRSKTTSYHCWSHRPIILLHRHDCLAARLVYYQMDRDLGLQAICLCWSRLLPCWYCCYAPVP